MTNMNAETRAQVARGWEVSGLSQEAYAAQHGISARTLRAWRQERHAGRQRSVRAAPPDTVRAVLVDTIGKLQAVLASVDTKAAISSQLTCSDGAVAAPPTPVAAPCHAAEVVGPEPTTVAAAAAQWPSDKEFGQQAHGGGSPLAVRRPSFDWEAEDAATSMPDVDVGSASARS